MCIWLCWVLVGACGIQFPDQGSDLGPLHWRCRQSLSHWTPREVPGYPFVMLSSPCQYEMAIFWENPCLFGSSLTSPYLFVEWIMNHEKKSVARSQSKTHVIHSQHAWAQTALDTGWGSWRQVDPTPAPQGRAEGAAARSRWRGGGIWGWGSGREVIG